MCLIVFSISKKTDSIDTDSEFSITLMANRDEYYERPTTSIDWWDDKPILAGKDLLAGGTWLGVNKNGRFAALTNYKEDGEQKTYELSRGKLITDYLESDSCTGPDYLSSLEGESFAGFNLLVSDEEAVHSYSNRKEGIITLTEGVHALGNRFLNSKTEKVNKIKEDFKEHQNRPYSLDGAFNMMSEDSGNLESETKEDLIKRDYEEIPYRFIRSKFYGTRCTTLLTIDSSKRISVSEQNYLEGGNLGERKGFKFLVT